MTRAVETADHCREGRRIINMGSISGIAVSSNLMPRNSMSKHTPWRPSGERSSMQLRSRRAQEPAINRNGLTTIQKIGI